MTATHNKSIFITGAAGFVGRRLVQRLLSIDYRRIYLLCRKKNPFLTNLAAQYPSVIIIRADLLEVAQYRKYLEESDIAIHMAAVTGKAQPDAYFRVNTEGTARFAEQCRLGGVRGLIYFSTIAVNFGDLSHYPYAQSKRDAEAVVRECGVPHVILRPTIILGPQSPIWQNFLTMARAPVPFVFGNGRTCIQPIHVDDLIDAVLYIVERERFDDTTHALGGAEVVAIEELVRKIRRRGTGRPVRRVLHIPIAPLAMMLKRLEPLMLEALPFTAGQLTSFTVDGVVAPDTALAAGWPHLEPLDTMVDRLVRFGEAEGMRAELASEGRTLARRLTRTPPPDLAIEKYIEAHRQGKVDTGAEGHWFEVLLCRIARIGPLYHLAEAYGAVFLRKGLLRKKLVLLAAILECLPESQKDFQEPESGTPVWFFLGLLPRLLATSLALLLSLPVFLPLQLLSGMSGRRSIERT